MKEETWGRIYAILSISAIILTFVPVVIFEYYWWFLLYVPSVVWLLLRFMGMVENDSSPKSLASSKEIFKEKNMKGGLKNK